MQGQVRIRSEEHTSELQSLAYLVCRLLLEKKTKAYRNPSTSQCDAGLPSTVAALAVFSHDTPSATLGLSKASGLALLFSFFFFFFIDPPPPQLSPPPPPPPLPR